MQLAGIGLVRVSADCVFWPQIFLIFAPGFWETNNGPAADNFKPVEPILGLFYRLPLPSTKNQSAFSVHVLHTVTLPPGAKHCKTASWFLCVVRSGPRYGLSQQNLAQCSNFCRAERQLMVFLSSCTLLLQQLRCVWVWVRLLYIGKLC